MRVENQGSVGVMVGDGGDLGGWRQHEPKGAKGVDLEVKWVKGLDLVVDLCLG